MAMQGEDKEMETTYCFFFWLLEYSMQCLRDPIHLFVPVCILSLGCISCALMKSCQYSRKYRLEPAVLSGAVPCASSLFLIQFSSMSDCWMPIRFPYFFLAKNKEIGMVPCSHKHFLLTFSTNWQLELNSSPEKWLTVSWSWNLRLKFVLPLFSV